MSPFEDLRPLQCGPLNPKNHPPFSYNLAKIGGLELRFKGEGSRERVMVEMRFKA